MVYLFQNSRTISSQIQVSESSYIQQISHIIICVKNHLWDENIYTLKDCSIEINDNILDGIKNSDIPDTAIKSKWKWIKEDSKESESKKVTCYIINDKKIEFEPWDFIPKLLSDTLSIEDESKYDKISKHIWEYYDQNSKYFKVIKDENLFKFLEVIFQRNKIQFKSLNERIEKGLCDESELENYFNKKINLNTAYLNLLRDQEHKYQLNHIKGYLDGEGMLKYLKSPSEQIYFEGEYKKTVGGDRSSIKIRRCHDYSMQLGEEIDKRKKQYKDDPCSDIRTEIDMKRDIEEEDLNFQDTSDQVESHWYKYYKNKKKSFNLYHNFSHQSITQHIDVSDI